MEEFNCEKSEDNKERILKLPHDIAEEVIKGQQLKHVEIKEKSALPTALGAFFSSTKMDESKYSLTVLIDISILMLNNCHIPRVNFNS